jgi:transposase
MTIISAICQDAIIANQIIEGGVDSIVFENFIYHTLLSIRNDKLLSERKVVLLIDNAPIHKSLRVLETARAMKAVLIFNAEYSPWLNPVEQFFKFLKAELKPKHISSK